MADKLFLSMFPFIAPKGPKSPPPVTIAQKKDLSCTNRYEPLAPVEVLSKSERRGFKRKMKAAPSILRESVLSDVVGEGKSAGTADTKSKADGVEGSSGNVVKGKRKRKRGKRRLVDNKDQKSNDKEELKIDGALDKMNISETNNDDNDAPPAKKKRRRRRKKTEPESLISKEDQENKKTKTPHNYVLFAGNLPYGVTKEELTTHFEKAGKVVTVRIPHSKEGNTPRGFAYLEMADEIAYQVGLSLHHSFLKGRRINVEYTKGGKGTDEKRRKAILHKNKKLHALMQSGKLKHVKLRKNKKGRKRLKV